MKDYDFVVVGSGFGGSVSALRLAEKGYRVLVLEKGKWMGPSEFPKSNWNLKRWMWNPLVGWHGLFKLSFFRHITVLSGVGVGGGSLVYANTLPVPKDDYFRSPSWSHLADWKKELEPFYGTARNMLGVSRNPGTERSDEVLRRVAEKVGRGDSWHPNDVAVLFGEEGTSIPDPYFGGKGPERQACQFCGACMIGCPHNAKNTLDKNYLHLAQQLGVEIRAESEVTDIVPIGRNDGSQGYAVEWQPLTRAGSGGIVRTKGIVLAGGVLGTVDLLLKLRENSLPRLSQKLGDSVRTNNESLLAVVSFDRTADFSKGLAIGSIFHASEKSHLEPCRYPSGSGFWRILFGPMVAGGSSISRASRLLWDVLRHPLANLRVATLNDFGKQSQILLFMQTIDSTLRFRRGAFGMRTQLESGPAPTAFIPEALDFARLYAEEIGGKPLASVTESLLGIPSTAHILGGAVMGAAADEGVIDREHRVFGYHNMYVCDGSAISANPGVNPSLSIAALAERAMSLIPKKFL